ncbi:hypothetical protein I4U23_024565 [Adineta vaga]|nr:hypothetical protein I4U23_024565 [Adineta vaga]
MSLVTYASCVIQSTRGEFERSIVELHKNVSNTYSLQAFDIQNKKAEIFNISFIRSSMYKFGPSLNSPDEIRYADTMYRLTLNPDSRDKFHEQLRMCFAQINSIKDKSTNSEYTNSSVNTSTWSGTKSQNVSSGNGILIDIHNFAESIQNGDANSAYNLASKLAVQGIQLIDKTSDDSQLNRPLRIRVKMDGIDIPKNLINEEHNLNIYESTTVHELKVIFQYTHGFSLNNQYFFVNGYLAHSKCSMNDLQIQNDAFFILFINEQV